MKISRLVAAAIIPGLPFLASTGVAHHSFASQFDADKPFTMVGTITEVAWRNPHAIVYMDVEGDDGDVSNWSMELVSTNVLLRRGMRRDALKAGDVVTVDGFLARDGSNVGNATTFTLNASGETLLTGPGGGQ